jgi:sugar phosphate isomerase/epimerase
MMDRRNFITTASVGALAATPFANALGQVANFRNQSGRISQLKKNTAIAMWDFTWILRHHPEGAFWDWDAVLAGLAERGYDSIRMDCLPQYVAADTDGRLQEEFRCSGNPQILWGCDVKSMTIRPREALLEFLPKCKKHGIKVGLSSWFMKHSGDRTAIFNEEGGLLRAWKETLAFLDKNGLLDENIMYVDLLNEYPDHHGYDWLKNERNKRSDLKQFKLNNPNAHMPDDVNPNGKNRNNPLEKAFYNGFVNDLIRDVRASFPQCDYFASISSSYGHVDLTHLAAIDRHLWFQMHWTGLYLKKGEDPKEEYSRLLAYWNANKDKEIAWMDGQIAEVSRHARDHGVVCGNTEGWGSVNWSYDVGWEFIREAAEICVDLCLKHDNYRFICTSNFTHPHFGFWDDIKWHQKITSKIKNARI